MKNSLLSLLIIFAASISIAQDKQTLKQMQKDVGYNIFSHKQFFENTKWSMCKFAIIYKLQSASKDYDNYGDARSDVKGKVKTGAYAVLDGLTNEDLEKITQQVALNFQKMMKDELGVDVEFWNSFQANENTKEIKETALDKEVFIKDEGLAYATCADNGPYYNHIITFVPGGKKLAKDLNSHVMELTIFIDFARFLVDANATVDGSSWATPSGRAYSYTINKTGTSKIIPKVHISPTPVGLPGSGNDSYGTISDIKLGTTGITGHDDKGYSFTMNFLAGPVGKLDHMVSQVDFADDIVLEENSIPQNLVNRKNKMTDFSFYYLVKTNPEKYGEAVYDATNNFFKDIVKAYKASKP